MTVQASSRARLARRAARLLVAAGLLATVSACSSVLPFNQPPPRQFQLTPKSTFDDGLAEVKWQLLVDPPFASAAINTLRIGLMTGPMEFDYYARANWTDRAPSMVHTLIVESFENTGRIVAIGRESVGLRADFVLKTELREFQAIALGNGMHQVVVGINAKLVKMPERAIVASTSIQRTARAPGANLTAVVAAFDTALGGVLKELVGWTLASGEAAYLPNRMKSPSTSPPDSMPGMPVSPYPARRYGITPREKQTSSDIAPVPSQSELAPIPPLDTLPPTG